MVLRHVMMVSLRTARTLHTASINAWEPGHDSKRCTLTLTRYTGVPSGYAVPYTSIVPNCCVRSDDNARRISSPGREAQRSCSRICTWVEPVCTTSWFFATCDGTSTGDT